jgi:hypothetical protein
MSIWDALTKIHSNRKHGRLHSTLNSSPVVVIQMFHSDVIRIGTSKIIGTPVRNSADDSHYDL